MGKYLAENHIIMFIGSQEAYLSINPDTHVVRLSTSEGGSLVVEYHDPDEGSVTGSKVSAVRVKVQYTGDPIITFQPEAWDETNDLKKIIEKIHENRRAKNSVSSSLRAPIASIPSFPRYKSRW